MAEEHRTVTRVISILEAAAASPSGVSLAALAASLNAPKSSIHGLTKGLVATGYLQESARGYTIGPAIGLLSTPDNPVGMVGARRALQTIQAASDETATLCTLVGDSVVYVDRVESTQMIRYSAPLRVRRPLYPTSAGKCFLAQMTPTRRERHVTALVSGPEAVARVLAELDQIARNGYSMNRGETVPDVYAVASPILINQRVAACLQVAGPSSRMAPRMDELAQLVKTEAQRLSYGSASAR